MSMLAFGRGSRDERSSRFAGRRALRPRKVVVGCRSLHSPQVQILYIHVLYTCPVRLAVVTISGRNLLHLLVFNGGTGAILLVAVLSYPSFDRIECILL